MGGFSFEDSFEGVGDFDVGLEVHLWFTLSFFGFFECNWFVNVRFVIAWLYYSRFFFSWEEGGGW